MPNRLKISLKKVHALEVTRIAIGSQKLAYALVADRKIKYPFGQSAIAYIGTTEAGVKRLASSAAERAESILGLHGVKKITTRIVICSPRRKVKTWKKLERALLLTFRHEYGAVPKCNQHGKKITEVDEFDYFSREALRRVITSLDLSVKS